MFEAYSTADTAYTLDEFVSFDTIRYTDCRVNTVNGTTFSINTPGRYFVRFGGVGSSSTAASPFSVQLLVNGVPVPAVRSEITSVAADDTQTLGFSTIINVLPSMCFIDNTARLQVQVTSEAAGTLYDTNLIIFRLK